MMERAEQLTSHRGGIRSVQKPRVPCLISRMKKIAPRPGFDCPATPPPEKESADANCQGNTPEILTPATPWASVAKTTATGASPRPTNATAAGGLSAIATFEA